MVIKKSEEMKQQCILLMRDKVGSQKKNGFGHLSAMDYNQIGNTICAHISPSIIHY